MALQVVAFPMVARALGEERFGVFTLVGSVLCFLEFSQFGIGGYLTQQVAARLPRGDEAGIRSMFWTSLSLVGLLGLGGAIGLGGVAQIWGLSWLWGTAAGQYGAVLWWGFHGMLFTGVSMALLNLFEGCQAGYQELHLGKLYHGAGNLFAAIVLVLLARWTSANELLFWLVLYGVPLGAMVVNSIALLRRHPELGYRASSFQIKLIPEILGAGGAFLIIQTVLPMVQREGSRLYLLHHGDLKEVGHFGAFLQIATIFAGALTLLTQPLYAALADATARGDRVWMGQRLRWMHRYGMGLAVLLTVGSQTLGPAAWRLWLGSDFARDASPFLPFACYFSVLALGHVNYVFLIGMGRLRQVSWVTLLEMSALILAIGICDPREVSGVFWVMAGVPLITSLPISTWLLRTLR
jgi:O-antigen/teichoic acid export membrane protein